eukprot:symbB.v1.2.003754.t1/scaffold207.1/size268535/1
MITVLYSSAKWEGLVPCATVAIRASSGPPARYAKQLPETKQYPCGNSVSRGDTLLRLTDAAALSEAKANQLGCWPLLVQRLGEIVQVHGTRWESHSLEVRDSEDLDAEVPGILLGQLKPLLSRHWDSGFEERSIGFFNEVGQFVNLRKMKHFIAELLKWRAKRQELVRSQALVASAVDQALETRLILATSTRHNDMVLCCSTRGRVTMSDGCKLGTPSTPSPTKAVLTSSTASEVNPLSPSDAFDARLFDGKSHADANFIWKI